MCHPLATHASLDANIDGDDYDDNTDGDDHDDNTDGDDMMINLLSTLIA